MTNNPRREALLETLEEELKRCGYSGSELEELMEVLENTLPPEGY